MIISWMMLPLILRIFLKTDIPFICFYIFLMYLTCVILWVYTPYLSSQSSGMSHLQTSTNVLGIFPGQGEIWICILKTSQNLSAALMSSLLYPHLCIALGIIGSMKLSAFDWVEVETGLWRRISNPWSSSLFFVFQMHDVCKSLFLVEHLIEGFLLPYTQTCCHILYHDDRNNCKGKANDGSGYTVNNLVRAGLCEKVYWKGLLKYERESYQNRGYHSMWEDQVCMLKGISGFNLFILRIIWGHRNEKAG